MSRSAVISQARTAASPMVTVIYSADRSARATVGRSGGGGGRIARALIGVLHLLVAGGVFYAVWWPIDKWMAVTLMMKVPIPIHAIGGLSGAADIRQPESGFSWLLSTELEAHPTSNPAGASGGGDAEAAPRLLYPMRARGAIAGSTMYAWQAVMALVVFLWSLAAGKRIGGSAGPSIRRAFGWAAWTIAAALGGWAAVTWMQSGRMFAVSAGQIGLGGLGVLFLLIGAAIGFRGRAVEYAASIWLILSAAASVLALTLADRCDALEPPQAAFAFKLLVFAAHSAYGWLVLAALLLRARASRPAFAPVR
ncbi:MAG: hypothetical protein IT449_13445 [Phycisphaerales bacterium]|nr:hypothetical protein [Phycisphaerales bacterium]